MTMRRAARASAVAAVALLALRGRPAEAQPGPMLLQLRPHPGDTLRLRLDQTIEMTRGGPLPNGATDGGDVASLVMLARIAVEDAGPDGAGVVAMTDSVRIAATGAYGSSAMLRGARALQGQHLRFRVAPDGSTTIPGADPGAAAASGAMFSQLPATLPRDPVSPGATWTRAVEIPLAVAPGIRSTALLTATFRFDSLSPNGELAWLTVRGRLTRSGPLQAGGQVAGSVETSGEVSGHLLVDRRRGWISDARTVVTLRSVISAKGRESSPVRARVKITQWLRVL